MAPRRTRKVSNEVPENELVGRAIAPARISGRPQLAAKLRKGIIMRVGVTTLVEEALLAQASEWGCPYSEVLRYGIALAMVKMGKLTEEEVARDATFANVRSMGML